MGVDNPSRRGVPRPLGGGPVQFGPYWLDARIAVGGTAEVYLARPIDPAATPKRLIVKRLLPHFVTDPEGRTMFEREAALHAAVRHENVVTVFGSGTHNDEPYLAMEYVEGVDCFRLLRRVGQEGQRLPVPVAVYVAREVLRALASVHTAKDAAGQAMGIIHRDVTPSNIYLSVDGRVKLGDFGIARSTARATVRNAASAMLKGKFAYLAPEQVAGEPFDHRADLFAMGAVLAEMLLGRPLFAGSGQLAVLLAIRDCRIEPLREIKRALPAGLFEVLEVALARSPEARYQSAVSFASALKPFEPDVDTARRELGTLIKWVQSVPSTDAMQAVRESAQALKAALHASDGSAKPASREIPIVVTQKASAPAVPPAPAPASARAETPSDVPPSSPSTARRPGITEDDFSRTTGEYTQIPSFVETSDGKRFGPWQFGQLVEALATGQVGRGDSVDYMGVGLRPIEEIDELMRFLPARTAITGQIAGLGSPDYHDDVSTAALLRIHLRVLDKRESGVLFADRAGDTSRKELYFKDGRLHHVASSNASELLGEYLVRRQRISREELDFALAVLPRYGGRMGDTLISLGLVSAVDMFRAIREQGRDRFTDLFAWRQGKLSYYSGAGAPGQTTPHVEFPLELELPALMLAGLEAAQPEDAPLDAFRAHLDRKVGPGVGRPNLRDATWPPLVLRVLESASEPCPVRDVLTACAKPGEIGASDVLRALELLLAAKLVVWCA